MAGERTLPGLSLTGFWDLGSDYKAQMDTNLQLLSAVCQLSVKNRDAALPGSPTLGDIYIVPDDDVTNPNKVAIWDGESGSEDWVYVDPADGWLAYVEDENSYYSFESGTWSILSTGGGGGGSPSGAPAIFASCEEDLTQVFVQDTFATVLFNVRTAEADLSGVTYSSGEFTLSSSGKVILAANTHKNGTDDPAFQIELDVGGVGTWVAVAHYGADGATASTGIQGGSAVAILDLDAGDKVRVRATFNGSPDVNFKFAMMAGGHRNMVQSSLTAAHTLDESDFAGTVVRKVDTSAADRTMTVDSGISNKEPVTFINEGANDVIFAAGGGVTINSKNGYLKINGQYAAATLIPDLDNADTYFLVGDLKE